MTSEFLLSIFLLVLAILLILILAGMLLTLIYFPKQHRKIPIDVYLVLGAAPTKEGNVSRMMKSRIDETIRQYELHPKPVIFTGGTPHSSISEARLMKEYAISQGIKENDIILEEEANNTYENFKYASSIIKAHGYHGVSVITNHFHVRRSAFFARKFGLYHMMVGASLQGYFHFPYIAMMYVIDLYLRMKCLWIELKMML